MEQKRDTMDKKMDAMENKLDKYYEGVVKYVWGYNAWVNVAKKMRKIRRKWPQLGMRSRGSWTQ